MEMILEYVGGEKHRGEGKELGGLPKKCGQNMYFFYYSCSIRADTSFDRE